MSATIDVKHLDKLVGYPFHFLHDSLLKGQMSNLFIPYLDCVQQGVRLFLEVIHNLYLRPIVAWQRLVALYIAQYLRGGVWPINQVFEIQLCNLLSRI